MDPVRIHNDMCARAFGRQHMTPRVKEAITGMRQRGIEEMRERFKQAAQEIAEIQVLTRPKEEIFRESQPTHVRETQRHLNHEFIIEAFKRTSSPDIRHEDSSFVEILRNGVPVREPVPKSYTLPEKKKSETSEKSHEVTTSKPVKLRTRPPSWMTRVSQERLWNEFRNSDDFDEAKELQPEDFVSRQREPVYAFGVEQGEENADGIFTKLRRILDWREGNKYSPFEEQIILYSHTCIFMMLAQMMSKKRVYMPICQYTKDLTFDTECTIQDNTTVEQENEGKPFVPVIGKLDFRKYFYQFGVTTPIENSIGVFDPFVNKYRFFMSNSCQFGNLHSIFWAVRFSLALMYFINEILGIPCIIYIDDTIYFVTSELFEEARELIILFYEACGIIMSSEKDENFLNTDGQEVKVLGLMYKVSVDAIVVFPPPGKVERTILKTKHLMDECVDGVLAPAVFEELTGSAVFLLYNQKTRNAFQTLRGIYKWAVPKFFYANIKRKKSKAHLLLLLQDLVVELSKETRLTFSENIVSAEPKLFYGDAALCEKGPYIGGFLATIDKNELQTPYEAFSTPLVKKWATKITKGARVDKVETIALYELLTILVGCFVFSAQIPEQRWLILCDNVIACYALVKGSSNGSPIMQAVVALILQE